MAKHTIESLLDQHRKVLDDPNLTLEPSEIFKFTYLTVRMIIAKVRCDLADTNHDRWAKKYNVEIDVLNAKCEMIDL